MNGKVISAIVLFVILLAGSISVFALFGVEHVWVNVSSTQNQIECDKCHANIAVEFDSLPVGAPHKNKPCEDCHRSDPNITYSVGDGSSSTLGKEAHAASIPACGMCHVLDIENITSANESHKPLYDKATLNEACIMCHSGFDKKMDFTRPLYIEYDITDTSGNWTLQNFSFVLSNTTTVISSQIGNKHYFNNTNCLNCHSDIKNAIENGGHVPKSGSTTSGQASPGHQGRIHNFDRSNITVDSCKSCHLANTSNFAPSRPHTGHAQLDYHGATVEHCYHCHYNAAPEQQYCASVDGCHKKLKSGDHKDVLDSMSSQYFCQYEIDKVCIGCHGTGYPSNPSSFGNKNFKVYTEPNATIIIT